MSKTVSSLRVPAPAPDLNITFIDLEMIMTYDNPNDITQDIGPYDLTITNDGGVTSQIGTSPRIRYAVFSGSNHFEITGSNATPINEGTLKNATDITFGFWFRTTNSAVQQFISMTFTSGSIQIGRAHV